MKEAVAGRRESTIEPTVFVALDVDEPQEAQAMAESLVGTGLGFKLGPRLMLREGASLVRGIAKHGPVFIDCKHLDIPSTMEAAIRAGFALGAQYSTIHALAGPEAMARLAKVEAELNEERAFRILTVTVLTSFSSETLPYALRGTDIGELALGLAKEAYAAGLKSFVCSPHEAARLRKAMPDAFLVTPGIRPTGSSKADQVRVETPSAAAQAGASALVVGRPILEASDRRLAALAIAKEFAENITRARI
ncbi:orotidine-5'-phosphate decarboxylase [soil metagenome]